MVFSGPVQFLRFREVSSLGVGGSLASPAHWKMGGAGKWRGIAKTQKKSLEVITPGTLVIIAHIQVPFSVFVLC